MKLYCGNNRLKKGVRFGSPEECFKMGFGVGVKSPVDNEYGKPYEPIDPTRVYCGGKDELPDGYDRFGNATECLRKGVGAGKRKAYQKSRSKKRKPSVRKSKKRKSVKKRSRSKRRK